MTPFNSWVSGVPGFPILEFPKMGSPEILPSAIDHPDLSAIVVIGLHLTALPPPDSSAAAPRVPKKNKNSEVARRHPDGLGTEHNTQSFSGC